jgi:hypothetical protein
MSLTMLDRPILDLLRIFSSRSISASRMPCAAQ